MSPRLRWLVGSGGVALVLSAALAGCSTSASNPSKPAGGSSTSPTNGGTDVATTKTPGDNAKGSGESTTAPSGDGSATPGGASTASAGSHWEGYPDVPLVPIMTEVDGITIPRLDVKAQKLDIRAKIPADVGNAHAKAKPSTPERGDWVVIRFNSEPKTLNPIVETSAVQSYISEYVQETLARRDNETLEYLPHTAEKWVVEDVVKLSADYPGKERRIAIGNGKPAAEATLDYPEKKNEKDDDPEFQASTSNAAGQPVGETWIGIYPVGKILGAPTNGYHIWSDSSGQAKISGLVPGKYTVRTGAEVYGKTTTEEDGSLVVAIESPGNPLEEELKSTGGKSLALKKGEWADVQKETVYTYTLRKDVKWSDGAPFTTKDILFAYATIRNPIVDGESLRVYYSDLVACDALDDYTVRMKYRQQYFKAFEFTLALAGVAPPFHYFANLFKGEGKELTLEKLTPEEETAQKKVSAWGQVYGRFFNTDDRYNLAPMGTGPYMVDKWTRGDRVELVRNPHHWNKDRAGHLDRIVVRFIDDNKTAMTALKAGEIDFFWNMDTEQYHKDLAGPPEWFKEKYVKAKWYTPAYGYVGWNLLKPIFQDRRVRIALGMLFDKDEFHKQKLYGDGEIVSGSQYYFGPGYDHDVKPLAYDPEVARELLTEAGWIDTDNDGVLDKDGEKFEFKYMIPPGNPIGEDRAALYQKSLKSVGILMEIRRLEWASFIDKVKAKDYDVVSLSWAQDIESDPYQLWHSSGAGPDKRGSNHVSFDNPESDQLIELLRLTNDPKKREKINYSLHRILDREQPYMFLYLPEDHGGYHNRFRGVKWYRVRPGFDLTEWYVPKDEQVHK